jgi:nitrite reductase (NO-forming)
MAIFILAAVLLMVGALVAMGAGMGSGWWGSMGGHMGSSGGSSGVSADPVAGASTVDVRAGDLWFEPDTVEVTAGETVNVTVTNEGRVFHDLTVPDLDFAIDVAAGDTITGVLEVPGTGEYEFLCTVPGHAGAGMRGELIVRDR